MKKYLFFFCTMMCLLPVLLQGQPTRVTRNMMVDSLEKTIIREYTYPVTISYVENDTAHLFIYNDGSMNNTVVSINLNYSINDFAIVEDYVYFCGATSTGVGFFALFPIYSFFFTNQSFELTSVPMYTLTNVVVASLDRMVAYGPVDNRTLAAVGRTATGQDCVVDMRLVTGAWTYRVGVPGNTYSERILDIIETGNYVVTGGIVYLGLYYPCIRVYDKNDIFSTTGIQNEFSFIFYNTAVYDFTFDSSQLIMAPVKGYDFFTMAAYYREVYNPSARGLYVGVFSASSATNPYISYSTAGNIQQMYQNGDWKLRGMTSPASPNTSNNFYLLQEAEYNMELPTESMVLELTYNLLNSSGVIPVQLSMNTKYYSIDGYNGNTQFIINGSDLANSQSLMICERCGSGDGDCMEVVSLRCNKQIMEPKAYTSAFSVLEVPMPMASIKNSIPYKITGTVYCE